MLILLPPSEGKAASGDGPPFDPAELALPELAPDRATVREALERLCAGPEETARRVLGLSASQGEAVKQNLALETAPALRAADLYTGVLYERLRLPELLERPAAAERARSRVLIFSGLWGTVGPEDRIPPYRLSMGVRLPPLGGLGAYWRRRLTPALDAIARGRLVVDCRSTTYAAAYRATGPVAERTVAVRVLRETRVGGQVRRSVVSHMAKATRGAVARTLLTEGVDASSPRELADALGGLAYTAELTAPEKPNTPHILDIVTGD